MEQPRQYYVAVSESSLRLPTLVDLLLALLANGPLGLTVSCGSRDSLNEVVGGIRASVPQAEVAVLHADLLADEVRDAVAAFDARLQRLQQPEPPAGSPGAGGREEQGAEPSAGSAPPDILSQVLYGGEPAAARPAQERPVESDPKAPAAQVLALTDELFRRLDPGFLPAGPELLVNFDLPARKETYARQLQALSARGSGSTKAGRRRIVVYFVAGGQIPAFRALEGWAGGPIAVMPVHAGDILQPARA